VHDEKQPSAASNQYASTAPDIQIWVGEAIIDAIQPVRHVLKQRLVANEITAIYGDPKSGKTFVAIACAVACATAGDFWGCNFSELGRVIYVAAERHEQAAERIRAQFKEVGLEQIPSNFVLVGGMPTIRLSQKPLVDQLKKLVSIVNPSLIVFDTYVRMTDNDEDNSRDADNNVLILSEVVRSSQKPCAGLLVHHGGKDPSRGMRGSSALLAAVTAVWKVVRKAKSGQVTLSMEDANAMALAEPCHFEIQSRLISSRDDLIEVGVAVPVEGPLRRPSRRDSVLELIRRSGSRGMSIDEVVAEVVLTTGSGSESAIRRCLDSLVTEGLVSGSYVGKKISYKPN
jgi:hypothetical protein